MESTKPRILLFTDWYLPGYKAGGPITSCANLVDHLSDHFDFYIITSDRDYLCETPYPEIRADQWVEVKGAKVYYTSPGAAKMGLWVKLIKEVDPEKVVLNGVFSSEYSIKPLLAARKCQVKTILAPRGMLASSALNIKSRKKKIYLSLVNLLGWYKDIAFLATSKTEAADIKRSVKGVKAISVIANLPSKPKIVGVRKKEKGQLKIVSIARIAPEKNTLFALQVLSKVSGDFQIQADFYGEIYAEDYFAKCENLVSQLPENIEVNFKGSVPKDALHSVYSEADLFFMPTRGENYGHAIIEALLHGLPVLISDQTPWKNLERDGLGAEYSLESKSAFVGFIENIASMNQADYDSKFKGVEERAENRIELNEMINSYIRLLA